MVTTLGSKRKLPQLTYQSLHKHCISGRIFSPSDATTNTDEFSVVLLNYKFGLVKMRIALKRIIKNILHQKLINFSSV